MLSKNEIKDIQSLRHKKFREDAKLFVAEGPKIIGELLTLFPQQFKKVYGLKEWVEENNRLTSKVCNFENNGRNGRRFVKRPRPYLRL